MKNNISYYSHDTNSHNHWKFKTLRIKYDWAGEGRFWALNNLIADSEKCRLDISNENQRRAVAADLGMTLEEFNDFITYLQEKCDLICIEYNVITTKRVQENLAIVTEKRERDRDRKTGKNREKLDKVSSEENRKKEVSDKKNDLSERKMEVSSLENEESKVNESKVNESKVNTSVADAPVEPEKPKKIKKRNQKPVEHWQLLVGAWKKFYREHFNNEKGDPFEIEFAPMHGSFLKRIVSNLKRLSDKQNKEWTQEYAVYTLQGFLQKAWNKDDWLRNNFELSILYSRYSSIISSKSQKNQANGIKPHNNRSGTSQKHIGTNISYDD